MKKHSKELARTDLTFSSTTLTLKCWFSFYGIAEGNITSEMLVRMDSVQTLLDQTFGVELMRKTVFLQGKANTKLSDQKG